MDHNLITKLISLMFSKGAIINYVRAFFGFLEPLTFSLYVIKDHPFKTSACLRGGGVKNWPNLPTDSSKKLTTEGGRVQKS